MSPRETLLSPSLDYVSVRTTEFGQGGRENESIHRQVVAEPGVPPARRTATNYRDDNAEQRIKNLLGQIQSKL